MGFIPLLNLEGYGEVSAAEMDTHSWSLPRDRSYWGTFLIMELMPAPTLSLNFVPGDWFRPRCPCTRLMASSASKWEMFPIPRAIPSDRVALPHQGHSTERGTRRDKEPRLDLSRQPVSRWVIPLPEYTRSPSGQGHHSATGPLQMDPSGTTTWIRSCVQD